MGIRLDILRTQRLAWAWRCAGVQEAGNLGNRPYVVPAWHRNWHDLGAISRGGRVWSMDYVCMNAGARTWARMGGCMRCCWAGLLCCAGPGTTSETKEGRKEGVYCP